MSFAKYDDNCPGCRPVVMTLEGDVLPDTHPVMVAINDVWKETTSAERVAWHAFTCQNAKDTVTLAMISRLRQRMQSACKAAQ